MKMLTSQDILSDKRQVVQCNLWRYKTLPVTSSVWKWRSRLPHPSCKPADGTENHFFQDGTELQNWDTVWGKRTSFPAVYRIWVASFVIFGEISNIPIWCQEVAEQLPGHEYVCKQTRKIGGYLVNRVMCIAAVPSSCCEKISQQTVFY